MAIARFLTKQLEKMDKAAKKMAGSPGYDEDTLAAQKEYAKEKKIEKSKKLSKEEEAAADKEAYASAMGKEKSTPKGKLTEKEKKQLQDELNMRKGGMVKKKPAAYAKGGMTKKPMAYNKGGMANCGASMKPAQKAKAK
jgi:hypothetical protein